MSENSESSRDSNPPDDEDEKMTYLEAIQCFLFSIALPTYDVYSDIYLIIKLCIAQCYPKYFFGFQLTVPLSEKYFGDRYTGAI